MYHPLSDSFTSFIRSTHARFSTCDTVMRWFLVMMCVWIDRIVCVSTFSHAICRRNIMKRESEWYQTANQADLINLTPHKTAKPINISTQIFVDRRWLSGDYECHIYGGFICTKRGNVACDSIASWFEPQLNCAMLQGNRSGWVNVAERSLKYFIVGGNVNVVTMENYFNDLMKAFDN